MPTTTSLLAQDDNDAPAMLSGPPNSALEEESALSRLITESTPASALNPFTAALDETTTQSYDTTNATHQQQRQKASLTTIVAGIFITLQWGFIWGAYFSKSWMDIHLTVIIGWQQKYIPWFNNHTDFVLQGMSVFTLSDNLKEEKEYGSLIGIWFCSVILPCVFMIVCPIWILTDYNEPPKKRSGNSSNYKFGQTISRLWLELTIRLSWLAAFIHMALNVAISGIEIQWEDTELQVHNAFKGPYISYLLGCTFALLCVVVLRMPYLEHLDYLLGYPGQTKEQRRPDPRRVAAAGVPEPPPPQAIRSPPPNAFRLPWLNSTANNSDDGSTAAAEAQQPLLENRQQQQQQQPQQEQGQRKARLSTWKHFVWFQLGFLSLLMWFPALALPQFRVLYDGLIMEMIKVPAYNVYVWELPQIIWSSGTKASTPIWILILIGILIGTFSILLPMVAHAVAAMTWWRTYKEEEGSDATAAATAAYGGGGRRHCRGNSSSSSTGKLRDLLVLLHPTLCGIPFAAGLVVTVPAFVDIGEDIDEDICTQIEKVVEDQCLISGGVTQWGAYFLLGQAICLEAFVFLTLWWTAPQPSSSTGPPNITV